MSDPFDPSASMTSDELEHAEAARKAFTAFLTVHGETLETLAAQAKRYVELLQQEVTPEMMLAAERFAQNAGILVPGPKRPPDEPPPPSGGLLN